MSLCYETDVKFICREEWDAGNAVRRFSYRLSEDTREDVLKSVQRAISPSIPHKDGGVHESLVNVVDTFFSDEDDKNSIFRALASWRGDPLLEDFVYYVEKEMGLSLIEDPPTFDKTPVSNAVNHTGEPLSWKVHDQEDDEDKVYTVLPHRYTIESMINEERMEGNVSMSEDVRNRKVTLCVGGIPIHRVSKNGSHVVGNQLYDTNMFEKFYPWDQEHGTLLVRTFHDASLVPGWFRGVVAVVETEKEYKLRDYLLYGHRDRPNCSKTRSTFKTDMMIHNIVIVHR